MHILLHNNTYYFTDSTQCCLSLNVDSIGLVRTVHFDTLGMYEYYRNHNGANAFKITGKEIFLYWNSDTAWMV